MLQAPKMSKQKYQSKQILSVFNCANILSFNWNPKIKNTTKNKRHKWRNCVIYANKKKRIHAHITFAYHCITFCFFFILVLYESSLWCLFFIFVCVCECVCVSVWVSFLFLNFCFFSCFFSKQRYFFDSKRQYTFFVFLDLGK